MEEPITPRLTIAIPTVNRAGLLGRAIESALAQTSPDIEIIVSDNGSTDDTPAVIERYSGRGLRTFRHPSTMPAAKHGRFLIEQAHGEFFVGLSDDDFLEPEFAAEVLALFDRHPELSFVYTGCAVHYEDCQVPAVVGPPLEAGASFSCGPLRRQARSLLVRLCDARSGPAGTRPATGGLHHRRHVLLDQVGVPGTYRLHTTRAVALCSFAISERQHVPRHAAGRLGARVAIVGERGDRGVAPGRCGYRLSVSFAD
jgi:glycosyltransferase involved in cell wall biosynthesis